MEKSEIRWVIYGTHGFYTGTSHTRKEAIKEHISALGVSWDYCKRRGDKAVKCIVIPVPKGYNSGTGTVIFKKK